MIGFYFEDLAGNFYSVELQTGKQVWHFAANSPILSSAAVNEGTVYFGVEDGSSLGLADQCRNLDICKDCQGKPLVIEARSRRVFPAQGYRKGSLHEEGWLIIESRHGNKQTELRYFFSNMPQEMPTFEMVRLFHERFWIEQVV